MLKILNINCREGLFPPVLMNKINLAAFPLGIEFGANYTRIVAQMEAVQRFHKEGCVSSKPCYRVIYMYAIGIKTLVWPFAAFKYGGVERVFYLEILTSIDGNGVILNVCFCHREWFYTPIGIHQAKPLLRKVAMDKSALRHDSFFWQHGKARP